VYVFKTGGITDYHAEIGRLETIPGVVAGAPVIMGKALIRGPAGDGFVSIKGIDPALERDVTEIAGAVTSGSFDALAADGDADADAPGILLGHDLAGTVGAFVGDSVTLLSSEGTLSPMGVLPRQRRLRVVGTFRLGVFEFDQSFGFVSLPTAMRLTGKDKPDHIELKVADIYEAPAIADRIASELGLDYGTQDWSDLNRQLYSALRLEKMAMGIGIGLIVVVAALNIIASLVLLVMEKTRDIAILKTMGAAAKSVMLIFLLQGMIIGLVGTLVGAVGGIAVSEVMDRFRVISIPSDVYGVTYLPFRVLPWDLVSTVLGAVIICFLATLYPSRQAARLDPAQALRYE
jgi:lipoprotein-releasing system permease protein